MKVKGKTDRVVPVDYEFQLYFFFLKGIPALLE